MAKKSNRSGLTINLHGTEEVQKMFSKLASDVKKELVANAVTTGMNKVAADARASTAFKDKTGDLRRGIKAEVYVGQNGVLAKIGVELPPGKTIGGGLPASTYPYMVEYGTQNSPAHPFLRPALNKNKSKINKDFEQAVINAAKEAT
jgi:HK97 gp10 family phage protein